MPGSAQISPLCAALKTKCTCFCLATLSIDGRQLAVEVLLDLLRQLLHFLLRVLGEPLQIALLPFDVRLQLCPRRIAQHAAALIELLLGACSALFLSCSSRDFCSWITLIFSAATLPSTDSGRHAPAC